MSIVSNVNSFPQDIYSADWVQIDETRRKFVHTWRQTNAANSVVCIVHGLGEHGGRYHALANDFVRAGCLVVAFDQQGHGQSSERRGCIKSYDSLLDDIEAFLAWSKSQHHAPHVLFGHSMGGNLVLNYAMRRKIIASAVISSSPMIRAMRPPSWMFEQLGRLLLMFFPNLRLQSVPRPERLMSDPEEQRMLREDPIFHGQLSLRLGGALLDSGRWALENASQLALPTLLTHGTDDCLTSPLASKEFAAKANELCQLELFNGHLHDPFRDLGREQAVDTFISFIQSYSTEVVP